MFRLLFAFAFTLSVTACGGGGSSSGSPAIPAGVPQAAQGSGATMPASIGTIAVGYIECDTAANIAAGNNCNNYANFSNGTFSFTAVAANASGSPIAQQVSGGSALGFANGSYRVTESPSDSPAMLSISGGPWATPGSVLSANGAAYGNRFYVQCIHTGTATLQLQLGDGSGLPLGTAAFTTNVATVNCTASFALTID